MQASNGHLKIEALSAGYRGNTVLKDIGFSVEKGQFVALLGSSGCGKTTLLRSIAGFEKPSAGSISVGGRDITALSPDKRGMSMVFQSYALWPHKTVEDHIGYGLKLRRMPRDQIAARVRKMEQMLGLESLGARRPMALSGGQRQRVALGRALAVEPEILLLDEPLSNLDARIRLQLRSEIRELQQRLGITAIHVTHDREEAMVMADRIIILNAGRIMQDATPQDIYNRPNSSFVAAFMGAENAVTLDAKTEDGATRIEAGADNEALPLHLPAGFAGAVEARFRASGPGLYPVHEQPSPAAGTLVLRGMVTGCTYPGGGWLHMLRIGDRQVQVLSQASHPNGTPVALHVPAESLFLFDAGSGLSLPDAGPASESGAGPRGRRSAGLLHA